VNWFTKNITPALLIALIVGCFGFFVDFQDLKARVFGIEMKTDINYKHIKESLEEIKTEVRDIKKRVQ
jgi:hypothetical protein